jgi:hypothetical protein
MNSIACSSLAPLRNERAESLQHGLGICNLAVVKRTSLGCDICSVDYQNQRVCSTVLGEHGVVLCDACYCQLASVAVYIGSCAKSNFGFPEAGAFEYSVGFGEMHVS